MRTGQADVVRLFQCRSRLRFRNRRKVIEELGQKLADVKVVEKHLKRYACTHEHEPLAHDFGISVNGGHGVIRHHVFPHGSFLREYAFARRRRMRRVGVTSRDQWDTEC